MLALIQFDRPGWLILALLIIPIISFSWRGLFKTGGRSRVAASTIVRCVVIILFSVSIARPVWEQEGDGIALITVLDRSHSIPPENHEAIAKALETWTDKNQRDLEDKLSVISIGEEAVIDSMPETYTLFGLSANEPVPTATNLAKGIQLALAIKPADSATRILLISDGNETEGDLLSAASLAGANQIPIDVLPVKYTHSKEVLVERVIVPAQIREGQTVPVRVVLRSISESSGVLHLSHNSHEINLNAESANLGLPLQLESGANVFVFDIPVIGTGPQKFDVTWTPDQNQDTISANNHGIGISFVHSGGKILIVSAKSEDSSNLEFILKSSGLDIEIVTPEAVPRDSIAFSVFDAVILIDIPRWSLDDAQEQHLYTFVHDLGGGILFVGGPSSFGAGGWIGSNLEQAMPLYCEPPQTRELPRGALALIMHSCEMPRGNYWGQRMADAAIESLSEMDYVGIIEYDWNGGSQTVNNSGWTLPMQLAGDKVAAHDAVNSLVFGDMQDFGSAMTLALDGLLNVDASQRHVIIISDGDPMGPSQELLESYQSGEVTISTVMVGGHGSAMDFQKMQGIATATGGRFYMVNDPSKLPNIFIKEAQLNSRSLIQEGQEFAVMRSQSVMGPVIDIDAIPPLQGYVVTGTKGGLAQTTWSIPVADANDPLLAWWNYGLGKTIAFTSDLGQRWATHWPSWSEYQSFWERCIRWMMRGSSPPNTLVTSRVEDNRGIVDMELLGDGTDYLNLMRSKAVLVDPSGKTHPLNLQQTGLGRYRAEFEVDDSGAWLVNALFQNQDGVVTGRIPVAVTVPFKKEFATTTHNAGLLHEVARMTNGRILSFKDQATESLFDKSNIHMPVSPTAVWDLIAMLAAILLILDVAIRRLWIDKSNFNALFASAPQPTDSSLEAYRRIRKESKNQSKIHIDSEESLEQGNESATEIKSQNSIAHLLRQKKSKDQDE